jgi:streptogramin lyase
VARFDRVRYVVALAVVATGTTLPLLPAHAAAGTFSSVTVGDAPIDVWPSPIQDALPTHLTVGPDGNLWAEAEGTNDVMRFDGRDGALLNTYPLPEANYSVYVGLAAGPDGNMWLGLNGRSRAAGAPDSATGNNAIVRLSPDGHRTLFPLSANGGPVVGPGPITAGPASDPNAMWFGDAAGGYHVGRISTDGTQIQNWSLPGVPSDEGVLAMTLGPDSAGTPNADVWLVMYNSASTNYVVQLHVTPAGPVVERLVPLPNTTWHTEPQGVAAGPIDPATGKQAGVWLTDNTNSSLGFIGYDGQMTTWSLTSLVDPEVTSNGSPELPWGITAGPDGRIWFAMMTTNTIAAFDPVTQAVTQYRPADGNPRPQYVVAGRDGNIWFVSTDQNKLGRITLKPVAEPAASASAFTVSQPFEYNQFFSVSGNNRVQAGFPLSIASQGNTLEVAMANGNRLQRVPPSLAGGPPPPSQEQQEPCGANKDSGTSTAWQSPWRTIYFADDAAPRSVIGNAGALSTSYVTLFTEAVEAVTPAQAGVVGDNCVATYSRTGALYCCFTYPGVSNDTGPDGLGVDPSGNVWFTEFSYGAVSRADPGTNADEEMLPTADSEPKNIAATPDGALWVTEFRAGNIARRQPNGNTWTEIPVGVQPMGITAGRDGAAWFTVLGENKVGRIDPVTMAVQTWTLPTPDSGPTAIVTGPDGHLYVTEFLTGKVARLTLDGSGAASWTEWTLPYGDLSRPYSMAVGPDSKIWVTLPYRDRIARLDSTVAPAAATITSPAESATVAKGTVRISGTASAGTLVEVVADGASIGTATAAANGRWSMRQTFAAGQHVLTARVTDAAGTASSTSAARRFTVLAGG